VKNIWRKEAFTKRKKEEEEEEEEEEEDMAKTVKLTEREVSTHSQRYALIQLTAACAHSLLSVSSMFLFG
jgi:hypothetical protein